MKTLKITITLTSSPEERKELQSLAEDLAEDFDAKIEIE